MGWYGGYGRWKPYVPVAKRRAQAARYAEKLAKQQKRTLCPVAIEGRKIAHTFWGEAWCENLERYSDFENRLPRGRTYVRNGSVIDLTIERGTIKALVSGSEVYRVKIAIHTLQKAAWTCIKQDCSQSIGSLIELLQGRFDEVVMQRLTREGDGLFPRPREIEMQCSCPDWAGMCKHVAAVLYGVGARLDTSPELLFTLRDVDHLELISQAVAAENLDQTLGANGDAALSASDLGELLASSWPGTKSRRRPASGGPPNWPRNAARQSQRRAKPESARNVVRPSESIRPVRQRKFPRDGSARASLGEKHLRDWEPARQPGSSRARS
jgi:uncharacterized Zn finger protein